MDKSDIFKTILAAIEMANYARADDAKIPVTENTLLYGDNGHLDSMGLVAFLIEIEEALMDREIQVSLSDERAMSQSRSPFRSVDALADYIDLLIKESA